MPLLLRHLYKSPLIPPSNIIVIYGGIMSLSIGALFMAGFIPGLIIALGQAAYVFFQCKNVLDLIKIHENIQ